MALAEKPAAGRAGQTDSRPADMVRHGLLMVHTGDGKGKTTAAFGLVARMLAHGGRCVVIQFIKRRRDQATTLLHHPRLQWHCVGTGFTWAGNSEQVVRAACETGWQLALRSLGDANVDLLVLDELNIALACDYLDLDEVLAALAARPGRQHVVVTGRHALPDLVAMAELVTEMREVKHPFAAGVAAQRGIEF